MVAVARSSGALRRYAHAVTAGERATPPKAAGEFGELGQALETMRTRLEGKQYVEQYVHTLTHEMKSPLAAIRGSAELLEHATTRADGGGRPRALRRQHPRAERAAGADDRQAAGAGGGRAPAAAGEPGALDTRRAGARCRRAMRAAAGEQAMSRRGRDGGELPPCDGDAFLLRQALVNLIDNAASISRRTGASIDVDASHATARAGAACA